MHCVLSGVFLEVLKTCYQSLSKAQKEEISSEVSQLSCPRELIAYSRKVISLEEFSQFKANELLNWLLYISPIVFMNKLTASLYNHLINLSFGVRLLLESSSDSNVSLAKTCLNIFYREMSNIHQGRGRVETINVHCLNHLPDQVKNFGPLFCQSAMSFEAANRTLGEVFTGSNTECAIICRRVLQRHKLLDKEIKNERLKSLYLNLSGCPNISANFTSEFLETEAVRQNKLKYPNAIFFNRQTSNNV